ncbi:MAG: hypothetical protein EKK41_16895 [Hyphomicrobiales bacterium]|nr:MAG: hypothetical protein EKK41_16895 [Hyphomicrobiales bacterium]
MAEVDRSAAKAAGYADVEINGFLAARTKRDTFEAKFDRRRATAYDYTDEQIDQYLDAKLTDVERALLSGPAYSDMRDALKPRPEKDDLLQRRKDFEAKINRAALKRGGFSDEMIDNAIANSVKDPTPFTALYARLKSIDEAGTKALQDLERQASEETQALYEKVFGTR